ncbi:MAG: hypothetical protein O6940_08895, partial [Ignavibacteria bacterium]|nr:hypothetical protein [Ignavibacteria bacterium]
YFIRQPTDTSSIVWSRQHTGVLDPHTSHYGCHQTAESLQLFAFALFSFCHKGAFSLQLFFPYLEVIFLLFYDQA